MTLPRTLPFAKMNGAGNSILVIDERSAGFVMTGEAARRIATEEVGFDQMMVIGRPSDPDVDAAIRIFNTDGSRAGACGNGTRCVAWVMLEGSSRTALRLDVEGTDVHCVRVAETRFTIDMGPPSFDWRSVPLRDALDTSAVAMGEVLTELGLPPPFAISMGNPHAVFFVPSVAEIDLATVGPRLERHPLFPDRVNVSFGQILARDRLLLRVWERGAGATLACGSAACATLVAAASLDLTGRQAEVSLPGGALHIEWAGDDHVMMTGPVELEMQGTLTLPEVVVA